MSHAGFQWSHAEVPGGYFDKFLWLAFLISITSACSQNDQYNNRRQVVNAQSSDDVNPSRPSSQQLVDLGGLTYQTRPWPTPAVEALEPQGCPDGATDESCSSDSAALVNVVDSFSTCLSTHGDRPLEDCVDHLLNMAERNPTSSTLQNLAQIAKCAKKIASQEYVDSLNGFEFGKYDFISDGRKRFLEEKGITIPPAASVLDNGSLNIKFEKMTLRQALERFGNRTGNFTGTQLRDLDGSVLNTQGALACRISLLPLEQKKFEQQSAAYPLTLTIIPPDNYLAIEPGSTVRFKAVLTNTYDTDGIYFSADSNIGYFMWVSSTEADLVASNWNYTDVEGNVSASFFAGMGGMESPTVSLKVKVLAMQMPTLDMGP